MFVQNNMAQNLIYQINIKCHWRLMQIIQFFFMLSVNANLVLLLKHW